MGLKNLIFFKKKSLSLHFLLTIINECAIDHEACAKMIQHQALLYVKKIKGAAAAQSIVCFFQMIK